MPPEILVSDEDGNRTSPTNSVRQFFTRLFSGLPMMIRPRRRTLSGVSTDESRSHSPNTLSPPLIVISGEKRRASLAPGYRRPLARRVPKRDYRKSLKHRRKSSARPSFSLHSPIHPPIVPIGEDASSEPQDSEPDEFKGHPMRRFSRLLSNAGPAIARRVSILRRKSIAIVDGDPELEDLELAPVRYRPIKLDQLCEATKFTKSELQFMYRGFKQDCPTGVITEEFFRQFYCKFFPIGNLTEDGTGRNSGMYAHYLFGTMDTEGNGHITFGDFIMGLSVLVKGTLEERINWVFNLYDINNDGYVTREELIDIVTSIYDLLGEESGPPNIADCTAADHVEKIFEKLDLNKDGVVTIDEFMEYCSKNENIVASMSFFDDP